MRFASALFALVMKFGGIGLLVLGVLDSSFLIAPWGNDLLVIAMTPRHPRVSYMVYYAAMSTVGSVLGCLLIDLTFARSAQKGWRSTFRSEDWSEFARRWAKMPESLWHSHRSLPAVPVYRVCNGCCRAAILAQAPPGVVGATRMVRFTLLGALAMRFGERILRWGANPVAQGIMVGLIVFSIVGSVVSVYGWIKRTKTREAAVNPGSR